MDRMNETSETENKNRFAFNIDEYDNKIKRTIPYYEELYKQVVDVVRTHVSGQLKWLDTGCGTGKMAEAVLQELEITRFTFCDCSPEMMKIAQSRYENTNADTEFLTKFTQELDFQAEFNVATAMLVNHYSKGDKRITAIQTCYDALETGGIFITFENYAPDSDTGKQLMLNRWKAFQLAQGRAPEEVKDHLNRYGSEYFPITIAEHLAILKSSGFQAVEIIWLSYMQVGFMAIK